MRSLIIFLTLPKDLQLLAGQPAQAGHCWCPWHAQTGSLQAASELEKHCCFGAEQGPAWT